MRAKSLKNISNQRVSLKFTSGERVSLTPGSSLENVNIVNEEEVKGKVHIVRDLTEVIEEKQMKVQLND